MNKTIRIETVEEFRRLGGERKEALDALYTKAHSLYEAGALADAETAYLQLLTQYPHHIKACHDLGLLYLEQERYEDAQIQLITALESAPFSAIYHYSFGRLLKSLADQSQAIRAYQQALSFDPSQLPAGNEKSLQDMEAAYVRAAEG